MASNYIQILLIIFLGILLFGNLGNIFKDLANSVNNFKDILKKP